MLADSFRHRPLNAYYGCAVVVVVVAKQIIRKYDKAGEYLQVSLWPEGCVRQSPRCHVKIAILETNAESDGENTRRRRRKKTVENGNKTKFEIIKREIFHSHSEKRHNQINYF